MSRLFLDLQDGSLTIVARGEKKDPPPAKAEGLLL
jgi:hypothetical protein